MLRLDRVWRVDGSSLSNRTVRRKGVFAKFGELGILAVRLLVRVGNGTEAEPPERGVFLVSKIEIRKIIFSLVPRTGICYTIPRWAKTHFGRGESPSHPRDGEVPLHLAESNLRHFL